MALRAGWIQRIFQAVGIGSPYLAVLLGVFLLKNAFAAVLFYHAILLTAIIAINGKESLKLLTKGYHGCWWPLICMGGLLPGIVIIFGWPIAKLDHANLSELFDTMNLDSRLFVVFAVYACLVNPFLEESFWRGCFTNRSLLPTPVDALFAGYHALAVCPVIRPLFAALLFLTMTLVGWLFRRFYNGTGGLLIPLVTHIIADITILYAFWTIMQ